MTIELLNNLYNEIESLVRLVEESDAKSYPSSTTDKKYYSMAAEPSVPYRAYEHSKERLLFQVRLIRDECEELKLNYAGNLDTEEELGLGQACMSMLFSSQVAKFEAEEYCELYEGIEESQLSVVKEPEAKYGRETPELFKRLFQKIEKVSSCLWQIIARNSNIKEWKISGKMEVPFLAEASVELIFNDGK